MAFNLPSFRRDIGRRNLADITNIFEEFYNNVSRVSPTLLTKNICRGFTPVIDILETDYDYCLEVELPGINQDNIDVKLENNILTIKGKKVIENEDKEKNYYIRERIYGEFQRRRASSKNT